MIILIAAPLGVFASKEAAMPLNVSAIKESDAYNFEIKNAKAKDEIEIEVKSEGNESKGLFKKNIITKDNNSFLPTFHSFFLISVLSILSCFRYAGL